MAMARTTTTTTTTRRGPGRGRGGGVWAMRGHVGVDDYLSSLDENDEGRDDDNDDCDGRGGGTMARMTAKYKALTAGGNDVVNTSATVDGG